MDRIFAENKSSNLNMISVIIPVYNAEKFVAECLLSVLNQTHKNFEVICVNDGSKDNSLSVLNAFQKEYPQLIRVVSVLNQGASKARNTGLMMATGNFIQFLDADDIITPEKFETQLKGFSEVVDVVISDRAQKNIDLTQTIETYFFEDILINPLETAVRKIITTCNPLYRKKVVLELNGYNIGISSSQDWEFHLRLVLNDYKIGYVPGVFFINRLVPGSLSSNWIKVSAQAIEIISELKSRLLEHPLMNDAIRAHIATIHFNTAIYCSDKSAAKKYAEAVVFWAPNADFLNSGVKKLFVKVFGYDILIRILRVFKKNNN